MLHIQDAPNFGCGFGDLGCVVQENIATGLFNATNAMGHFAADTLKNAYTSTQLGSQEWSVGSAQFWFWVAVIGGILVIVACVQTIPAMMTANLPRLAQIWVGTALAVPVALLGVYAMHQLSTFVDDVTDALLAVIQGSNGLVSGLLGMFGVQVDASGTANMDVFYTIMNAASGSAASEIPSAAEGAFLMGFLLMGFLLMAFVWLASMVLTVMMGIRAIGLVALAAVAPIALMMWGQPVLAAWTNRWITLTLGLLMAKPLSAAVLLVVVQLLSHTTSFGIWLAALGALFVAACTPVWAVGLVNFAGHAASHGWGNGSGVGRRAASLGRSAGRTAWKAVR